jgi:homoserine dehydrogenase
LIVLKFGGSVLLDEQRLRIAVHEIYRWRRDGWRVIAVVSALAGRTEDLIAKCALSFANPSDQSKASLIASGELESASLLGVHLDRAGIPAVVLSPASIQLVAEGDPLDSTPVKLNRSKIDKALSIEGVVIIPGFTAINESGSTVTLGRGGSDLTAVFLAHNLQADRCRLIKDIDGLYESDPVRNSLKPPRRFGYASYLDAMQTDGTIIQHKAVQYAESNDLEFELGRFNGLRPTRIGSGLTTYTDSPDRSEILDIAICGLGTVGRGVLELIEQLPDLFSISGAACKTPSKHTDLRGIADCISDNADLVAGSGARIVLELIGGTETAHHVVKKALDSQSHVITANKALIAQRHDELHERAHEQEVTIRYSASVGGVAPVIEAIESRSPEKTPVCSVRGVLNGTGNFVLGALETGVGLEETIKEAQLQGFAEADPSRDLDGYDSLDKLLVVAHRLGWSVNSKQAEVESISDWVSNTDQSRFPVRHIATLNKQGASVLIEAVDPSDEFGILKDEWNAAVIEFEDGSIQVVKGKGAGKWPTSESVFADLLELSREITLANAERETTYVS